MAELSLVRCAGGPRQRGEAHGEALRDVIRATFARWRESLARPGRVEPGAYLAQLVGETGYAAAMARHTPELLEEIAGIAAGAGLPYAELLAYNLLDEEWWYGRAHPAAAPGCTVVGLRATREGPPALAQTMDISAIYDGAQAVLHLLPDDGPPALVFTLAGMVGLNGCNADGVGVVVNNLAMLPHSSAGLPVAAVLRGALARRSLGAACAFIAGVGHASGQHYAVGSPEGLRSLECSAAGVAEDLGAAPCLLHTNHPLTEAGRAGGWRPADTPSSCARYDAVAARAPGMAALADLEEALRDRGAPVSIAAQPGRSFSFGATSMLLSSPPRVRVSPGPPHSTAFVELQIAG